MRVLLTTPVPAVEFQQPLGESEVVQDSPLLTLPLEILEQIGRACSDGPTAIAYTRSCRCLYALRPRILTTDLQKLSWTLQKLLSSASKVFLKPFLEYCQSSPFRQASFMLFADDEDSKKQVEAVFPNVLAFYERPVILDNGRILRHLIQDQERIRPQIERIQDLIQIRREPPRILDYILQNNPQPLLINPLPQPPVLNLIQMLQIQHEMQRLEELQQQRNAVADVANQIRNFIQRLF